MTLNGTSGDACCFEPGKFLIEGSCARRTADLVILNQPIAHFSVFSRLWDHARYRICADGGANRLHDLFRDDLESKRAQYLPDAVHGDLDSLRDDVREYYAQHGVEVSQDRDQYSTDFGKTMQKLSLRVEPSLLSRQDVLVMGTLGGRVDQGLGLLHEMIREERKHENLQLWLFSGSSATFILKSGRNVIRGLRSSKLFTENVGLVPIYGRAIISTSGLEWDVRDWDTEMGGKVSTSNHVQADEVEVETSEPILFTIERAPLAATSN